MIKIGVQSKGIIDDANCKTGFGVIKRTGFSCVDFSLNAYLTSSFLYHSEVNDFFSQSDYQLEEYFRKYKEAAKETGIMINQIHMPYPIYVPHGSDSLNSYLRNVVALKSMKICSFLKCPYIVIHGFKLRDILGAEEYEWQETERFLDFLAPIAKERGIVICVENLYTSIGGHLVEGPCCNVQKAVERIDRFNEKYQEEVLGFCFDTGHANIVGIDFEEFITRLGTHLKVLHIHDNDTISDLHQIPFTFTKTRENMSSTDWEGFIRGLRKIHFDKVLSFETAPVLTAFPEEMKEDILRLIAEIGKYFARKIQKNQEY